MPIKCSRRRSTFVVLTGVALSTSCTEAITDGTGLEATPAEMVVVSGDNQVAPPGTELPEPLVVQVFNGAGSPLANQIVNFRITAGDGTVFAGVSKTNSQGIARERWTLGPQEGTQRLEARAVDTWNGAAYVFAAFKATASNTPPPPGPVATTVTVTPERDTTTVGATIQLQATVQDQNGTTMTGQTITWLSRNTGIATVNGSGVVTGVAAGTARIVATSGTLTDSAFVVVQAATTPPPPPSGGDLVVYPSEAVAFIAGPQLRSGVAANPWPWFDQNAITKGLEHGNNFPATPTNTDDYLLANYYDQALAQYINYYRTGDVRFRDLGRKVADSWWRSRWINAGTGDPWQLAPREVALDGLILRAMDGRPEMWPWILSWVRTHYDVWLGQRLNNSVLYYGVRDGGFTLAYAAQLAVAHPDPAVRTEMRDKALRAARDYYARLQRTDGSWRWTEDPADNSTTPHEQPFMVGMMMEGLVATHQLTNDATVRAAILKGVDHLYALAYRKDSFTQWGGGRWRGFWYTVFGSQCNPPVPGACGEGQPMDYEDKVREVRQLNPMALHAFGYAYKISGDPKYRTQGDEIFAATFGKGVGPGADKWYGLADYRPREYNQSYRTAGRYLAWRAGF